MGQAALALSDRDYSRSNSSAPAGYATRFMEPIEALEPKENYEFTLELGNSPMVLQSNISELPEYMMEAIATLSEIQNLSANWNSYGARPIAPEAISNTFRIFVDGLKATRVKPTFSPTSRGDVDISWAGNAAELELAVTEKGTFRDVLFCDLRTGEEWEPDQVPSTDEVMHYLRRITD